MKDIANRMPLEELEKTQEYQRLTPKQKLFVASYCEGGRVDGNYNSVTATQTAYACKDAETARVMSYAVMGNIKIIAVLNRHFGAEPIEQFLSMLDRAINNKKVSVAQIMALRLKCKILGFDTGLPEQAPMVAALAEAKGVEKSKRKPQRKTRVPKPEPKSQYDDY